MKNPHTPKKTIAERICDRCAHGVIQKIHFFIFAVFVSPIVGVLILPAIWFPEAHTIATACGILILLTLVACWILSMKTAYLVVEEQMTLRIALLHSILPYLMVIHWLPEADRISQWIRSRYKTPTRQRLLRRKTETGRGSERIK